MHQTKVLGILKNLETSYKKLKDLNFKWCCWYSLSPELAMQALDYHEAENKIEDKYEQCWNQSSVSKIVYGIFSKQSDHWFGISSKRSHFQHCFSHAVF